MPRCSVPRCTSRTGKTKNVSFHSFPSNEGLANLWNKILKLGKPYTKYTRVCSLHFLSPGDFITISYRNCATGQRRMLRYNAIPSQNLPLEPPGLWVPNHATTMPDTQVLSPVISSVSSLSQPVEQGKQNMVPTVTTAPIDIKTEILEIDSIDIKPAISSVSSLSQPAEQGQQNMVPTVTTAPIDIKTEILETDSIDIKQEPLGDETLSIDLDTIPDSMYEQKPQLDLPAYDLIPHTNRALSHQPLSNKPQNIPVNPDPNRIVYIVSSGPSQEAPKGRAENANVVELTKTMVFDVRERERIFLNSLKTKIICDKCVMSLKTESAYIAHLVKHLPETGPIVCNICELRFKKTEHFTQHYRAHFRAYSCGKCRGISFVCHHWSTMELHLDAHERMSTYDQCGVVFKTTDEIVCPQCKLKFLSQASFDEHVRVDPIVKVVHIHEYHHMFKYRSLISQFGNPNKRKRNLHRFAHQSVKCKLCNVVMEGLRGLKTHYMPNKICGNYGAVIVKDQAFQSKEMLNKHIDLKKKLEVANYCCDVCSKTFTTKTILHNHQSIHSGMGVYQGDLCPWNFTQKSSLQTHMKLKHINKGANSAAPAAAASSAANVRKQKDGTTQLNTTTTTTQSYCSKCDKSFETRLCFIRHLLTKAHYTGWFECDYCGKKYSTKNILSTHIELSHMKTGNYFACGKCGEAFQSKEMLNKHIKMKKKLGVANYCCDVCGKTLTTGGALTSHQRIHSDIRAYQCDLCPWNFTQKSTLQTHMKRKHKKKAPTVRPPPPLPALPT